MNDWQEGGVYFDLIIVLYDVTECQKMKKIYNKLY